MPRRDSRSKTVPPALNKSPTSDSKKGSTSTSPNVAPSGTPSASEPQTKPNTPAGSGFLAQMAATAGGVAIGSAVGRALGGLFDGTETKDEKSNVIPVEPKVASSAISTEPAKHAASGECEWEIKRFVACVLDDPADMKLCEGFMEAMRQCKKSSKTEFFYEA
ncbi:AGAP005580-PA-like protein [Anopheles sinensis]|uniref:AGAP005580-PA-like protein n=1 Tax=Anopheles sinensis TaxID=74873 RepID=A0A084WKP0_ANOSI|nr:AGAP005580-PA-like protein [Anopheles sinensis]